MAEIEKAKISGIKDSVTDNMLIIHPLYTKAKNEIDRFLNEKNIKIKIETNSVGIRNSESFKSGQAAATSISLKANAVQGDSDIIRRIASA